MNPLVNAISGIHVRFCGSNLQCGSLYELNQIFGKEGEAPGNEISYGRSNSMVWLFRTSTPISRENVW